MIVCSSLIYLTSYKLFRRAILLLFSGRSTIRIVNNAIYPLNERDSGFLVTYIPQACETRSDRNCNLYPLDPLVITFVTSSFTATKNLAQTRGNKIYPQKDANLSHSSKNSYASKQILSRVRNSAPARRNFVFLTKAMNRYVCELGLVARLAAKRSAMYPSLH